MEIRNTVRDVSTNLEGKAFTIKASAKAFKILSDGLYSDKITAIIRELSANAYDSHISAGNLKRPFDIHLPGYSQDYFFIRDYGISMTHEQVMELYTTYFGSDKTDSNELIGALGLGSKSPFSYTDKFNVTTFLDGVKRQYIAFFDKSGTPTISLMSESKTSEDNGVEIKFLVNPNDYDSFINKAKSVYRYYKVKPNVVSLHDIHTHDIPYISGNDWFVFRKCNATAIQGNIAYPINEEYFTGKARFVASNSFIVYFDIGQIDVSASRESISYDNQTIQNMQSRLEQVFDEICSQISIDISNEKTEWNAKLKVLEIKNVFYNINIMNLQYKGKKIDSNDYTYKFDDFPGVKITKYWRHSSYRADYIKREEITKQKTRWGTNHSCTIPVKSDIIVVVDDGSKNKISRVRFVAYTSNKTVFLIELATSKFLSSIGKPPSIKLCKLEVPPKDTSSIENKIYVPLTKEGFIKKNSVSETALTGEHLYYVVLKRGHISKLNSYVLHHDVCAHLAKSKESGLIEEDAQIYCVNSYEIKTKRFLKLNMRDFYSHIYKECKRRVSLMSDDIDEYYKSITRYNSLRNISAVSKAIYSDDILSKINPQSKVFELYSEVLDIKTEHESFIKESNEVILMIEMTKILNVSAPLNDHECKTPSVEKYYPMLKHINSYSIDTQEVVDYINLVDSSMRV